MFSGFEDEVERGLRQGMLTSLEAEKGKKIDSSLAPPEKNAVLPTS